jgi:hypothetical protein
LHRPLCCRSTHVSLYGQIPVGHGMGRFGISCDAYTGQIEANKGFQLSAVAWIFPNNIPTMAVVVLRIPCFAWVWRCAAFLQATYRFARLSLGHLPAALAPTPDTISKIAISGCSGDMVCGFDISAVPCDSTTKSANGQDLTSARRKWGSTIAALKMASMTHYCGLDHNSDHI